MQTNSSTTGSNYSNNSHDSHVQVQLVLIYDFILGVGFIVLSILALSNLFIVTINKFVEYYSRQIDRIVMDESESECSDDDEDDDDSSESEYSEYSENESSEYSESECDDGDSYHYSYKNKKKQTLYVSPRRSERLLNRAKCNSPLLIRRLKFD